MSTRAEYVNLVEQHGHKMGPSYSLGAPVRANVAPPGILGAIRFAGSRRKRAMYMMPHGRVVIEFDDDQPYHWSFWRTSVDPFNRSDFIDPHDMSRHGIMSRSEIVITRNCGFAIYDDECLRRVTWVRDYPNSIEITDYHASPLMIGVSRDIIDAWMNPDAEVYIHSPSRTEAILRWYDEVCRHCPKRPVATTQPALLMFAGISEKDIENWGL